MLTVINKQDMTQNVPHDSIQIDSVVGDPLGKAQFKVVDSGAHIPLQAMQEVIFVDENVQLLRITGTSGVGISAPYSDTFSTNTSGNYTQTLASGGTASSWTWSVH